MNLKEQLKEFLQQPYKDSDTFLKNVIFPVFGQNSFIDAGRLNILKKMPEVKAKADTSGISSIINLGGIYIEGSQLDIFDITVSSRRQLARSRVEIQEIVRRIISNYAGAFMIFHYETTENKWDWRFTFCRKGANMLDSTDSKRYTFLLGKDQSCRTAAENFCKLHDTLESKGELELDDIVSAFDVEALSKEFFEKYKAFYIKFVGFMLDEANGMRQNFIDKEFDRKGMTTEAIKEKEEKPIRDYVKRLLGRLVFLQFLQKKGWLGVPEDKDWGEGDTSFLQNLFFNATCAQKANFLDEILEPLFANAFDTDRSNEQDFFDTKVEGYHKIKIPYLNGGLFSRDIYDETKSVFDTNLFKDLFDFFSQYNFTIDENDPNDAEVGIDPEMLGRIFENLLEDNKDKGAFYTPKEIVQHMCRESIIAFLQTNIKDQLTCDSLRQFVTTHDNSYLGGRDTTLATLVDRKLREVKICDPAIGSGAFPMGMLRELFLCRSSIEGWEQDVSVFIKKEIIQQNIYGVDIEKGAVDIARLRFWLNLILDERTPHTLPNLDFKIMQGNSLLEQYEGVDLTGIAQNELAKKRSKIKKHEAYEQTLAFDEEISLQNIQNSIKKYYNTDCYNSKIALRNIINNNVKSYIINFKGCTPDIKERIKNLPIPNEKFFLWHIYFKEVFDNGGFDIVIGNPPYIRHEKLDILYKHLLCSIYSDVGEGTADILVYFFGLGMNILTDNGILCYITSNKFLKTKYGKSLRNALSNNVDVLSFIDFFELPVFNNASTDAGITLLRNKMPTSETKYFPVMTLKDLDLDKLIKGPYKNTIKNESEWQFVKTEEYSIIGKLNSDAVPLTSFVNNRIYSGVKTGLNDTFMLSSDLRESILSECSSEDEFERTKCIFKKAFRSRDIRKYVYNGPEIWLLFIPWHFPLKFEEAEKMRTNEALFLAEKKLKEDYPSLFKYLNSNKEKLSGRNQDETGKRYEWYALQRWGANYYKEFDEEKLIYIHTAKNHEFYYDMDRHFVNNSCYIIASKSKFLYCFLNSALFRYFKKIKFVAYGNGDDAGRCKLDGNKMATVPIKLGVNESKFEEKFGQLQKLISSNPKADTSFIEQEIDMLIYNLYGLTKEEIEIVERQNA